MKWLEIVRQRVRSLLQSLTVQKHVIVPLSRITRKERSGSNLTSSSNLPSLIITPRKQASISSFSSHSSHSSISKPSPVPFPGSCSPSAGTCSGASFQRYTTSPRPIVRRRHFPQIVRESLMRVRRVEWLHCDVHERVVLKMRQIASSSGDRARREGLESGCSGGVG